LSVKKREYGIDLKSNKESFKFMAKETPVNRAYRYPIILKILSDGKFIVTL